MCHRREEVASHFLHGYLSLLQPCNVCANGYYLGALVDHRGFDLDVPTGTFGAKYRLKSASSTRCLCVDAKYIGPQILSQNSSPLLTGVVREIITLTRLVHAFSIARFLSN